MNRIIRRLALVITLATLAVGCVSQTIKTTSIPAIQTPSKSVVDEQLLDVSIAAFFSSLETEQQRDKSTIRKVRQLESSFLPQRLMSTVQESGAWSAVRVVPNNDQLTDLMITGVILESNGQTLSLEINAKDATGRIWLKDKVYKHEASRYAYSKTTRQVEDPFASIYVQIANDLFTTLEKLTATERENIRQIAEMRFAGRFAPSAFSDYISEKNGNYSLLKLRAVDDPMLARLRRLRDIDHAFVDALLQSYEDYSLSIEKPYHTYRWASFKEHQYIAALKRENKAQLGALGLSLASAIFASNNRTKIGEPKDDTQIDIGEPINQMLQISNEIEMHVAALEELSQTFENNTQPFLIRLDDSIISLEGNLQDQYARWRVLLEEIYQMEIGSLPELLPKQNGT